MSPQHSGPSAETPAFLVGNSLSTKNFRSIDDPLTSQQGNHPWLLRHFIENPNDHERDPSQTQRQPDGVCPAARSGGARRALHDGLTKSPYGHQPCSYHIDAQSIILTGAPLTWTPPRCPRPCAGGCCFLEGDLVPIWLGRSGHEAPALAQRGDPERSEASPAHSPLHNPRKMTRPYHRPQHDAGHCPTPSFLPTRPTGGARTWWGQR